MSKLLPALLLLLLVAMSSSNLLTDLVTMRSQGEVPHFFRMPDKQNANMCCAKCIDEKVCFLITENLTSMCAGRLGHTQIGRVNFPGGRMIATSKLTNDVWKLFWIDDEDDHVLNSRDFSLPECRWKSRVRTDESVAGAVVDMLVDLAHDRDQVRVSFEPVGCAKHTCDVTFYWRETFLPKKYPLKTTLEPEIEEKEDL